MNKIFFMIFICCFICACALKPKTIYVPVVVNCPKFAPIPKLHYPVADLKQGDSAQKVAKAWVTSFTMCNWELTKSTKQSEVLQ